MKLLGYVDNAEAADPLIAFLPRGVEVRCSVCRRRDWEQGGPGRADIVAFVLLSESRWWPVHRRDDEIRKSPPLRLTPDGLKVKCRRNHRINKTAEDVADAVEKAQRLGKPAFL